MTAVVRPQPGFHVAPPDLPASLISIEPATIRVAVLYRSVRGVSTMRHTLTRTSDRVHLSHFDGREWLFERHGGDARRVSGFLSHHDTRTIVVHEECDLLSWLNIRGWFDVVGFSTNPLAMRSLFPACDRAQARVIVESQAEVNPVLLRPPYIRFPDYRLIDLGQWFAA